MEHPELAISIENFNSTPMLSLSGTMIAWHGPTIGVALRSFFEAAERELILDVTGLSFVGAEDSSAFLAALRSLPPEIRIHLVADSKFARILRKADFGPCISISTTLEDLAESALPGERFLTSRWLPRTEEEELPLAA